MWPPVPRRRRPVHHRAADGDTVTGRPGAGREDRPRKGLQRTGGDQHQRPVAYLAGERAEEGLVDVLRRVTEHGDGGLLAGPVHVAAGQPVQGERHPLDVVADVRQRPQAPQPDAPGDDGDGGQAAIELDELDQRGFPQRGREP